MIENRQEAINQLIAELAKTQKACCWRELAKGDYSVEGANGSDIAYAAACVIGRWGYHAHDDTAWDLFTRWNTYWAHPPWSDSELQKKLEDGIRRTEDDGEFGSSVKEEHRVLDLKIADGLDFLEKEFKHEFLIDNVLVASQTIVVSGPQKCLKTSMLMDMVLSLSTGTDFLGAFSVPNVVPSLMLSGESGGATLQDTMRRIMAERGLVLQRDTMFVGERLPQLSIASQLRALGKDIRDRGIKFCAIDPAYLCILSNKIVDQSSNLYAMGTILERLGALGDATGCTIAIAHHHKKSSRDNFNQPSMFDLSGAGWGEWMRQWLLLNHRERMRDGMFKLWLGTGGSAGHHGMYAVDVDEGQPEDPLTGRTWKVTVRDERQFEHEQSQLAEEAENDKTQQTVSLICSYLRGLNGGATKTQLRAALPGNIEKALVWAIRQRRIKIGEDEKRYELRDDLEWLEGEW